MKFTLKRPCKTCPFRTDVTPFLTKGRARQIVGSIVDQQQTFPCHNTIDYGGQDEDDEGDTIYTPGDPNEQHCAGALILLEKIGKPNQMMRIRERLGMYDHKALEMDAPVFATTAAFIRAQE